MNENKIKKPIYKRWWFWAIIVVILFAAFGSGDSDAGDDAAAPKTSDVSVANREPIEYSAYTVDEMVDTLEANALKAETLYGNQYVEITGRLSNIDSDGKYISLNPTDGRFTLTGVQCYIKSNDQKLHVIELSIGDIITVRGKITSVGEVLGYSLDIEEILD